MTESESDSDFEWVSNATPRYDAVHVENDGAPDEYAIFAADTGAMTTVWLSASGDGFVDLDDWR